MKISLLEFLAKLPLPATEKWPRGVWDIEAFAKNRLSLLLFAPKYRDFQTPHTQDELYIVVRGNGTLILDGNGIEFATGDVLFVPAGAEHRFVKFSEDLVTWVVFWGPGRDTGKVATDE